METMKLWNAVSQTDKQHLKQMTFGAKLTSICAYSQIKSATEQWGSYGEKWGVKEIIYGYQEKEIWIEGIFVYPGGSFQISSDMVYRLGGDCRKKLLTDIITKGLSYLGYNADVFMNQLKFVDNKYINIEREKGINAAQKEQDVLSSQIKAQELINKNLDLLDLCNRMVKLGVDEKHLFQGIEEEKYNIENIISRFTKFLIAKEKNETNK